VALEREKRVVPSHPRAVVAHPDALPAAIFREDVDGARTGVEGILDELLHDRRGALDDFAGRDLIGDRRRKHGDT